MDVRCRRREKETAEWMVDGVFDGKQPTTSLNTLAPELGGGPGAGAWVKENNSGSILGCDGR
jgi:hypothetical protein